MRLSATYRKTLLAHRHGDGRFSRTEAYSGALQKDHRPNETCIHDREKHNANQVIRKGEKLLLDRIRTDMLRHHLCRQLARLRIEHDQEKYRRKACSHEKSEAQRYSCSPKSRHSLVVL